MPKRRTDYSRLIPPREYEVLMRKLCALFGINFFKNKTGPLITYFRITCYHFHHKAKAPPLKKKKKNLTKHKDMRMIDIQGTAVPHIENFVYSSAIVSRKFVTESIVVAKFHAK